MPTQTLLPGEGLVADCAAESETPVRRRSVLAKAADPRECRRALRALPGLPRLQTALPVLAEEVDGCKLTRTVLASELLPGWWRGDGMALEPWTHFRLWLDFRALRDDIWRSFCPCFQSGLRLFAHRVVALFWFYTSLRNRRKDFGRLYASFIVLQESQLALNLSQQSREVVSWHRLLECHPPAVVLPLEAVDSHLVEGTLEGAFNATPLLLTASTRVEGDQMRARGRGKEGLAADGARLHPAGKPVTSGGEPY